MCTVLVTPKSINYIPQCIFLPVPARQYIEMSAPLVCMFRIVDTSCIVQRRVCVYVCHPLKNYFPYTLKMNLS